MAGSLRKTLSRRLRFNSRHVNYVRQQVRPVNGQTSHEFSGVNAATDARQRGSEHNIFAVLGELVRQSGSASAYRNSDILESIQNLCDNVVAANRRPASFANPKCSAISQALLP